MQQDRGRKLLGEKMEEGYTSPKTVTERWASGGCPLPHLWAAVCCGSWMRAKTGDATPRCFYVVTWKPQVDQEAVGLEEASGHLAHLQEPTMKMVKFNH